MDHGIDETLLSGTNEIEQRVYSEEEQTDKFLIENKKIWLVVVPAVVGRFSNACMNIISNMITRAFVGHVGSTELAAYALVSTVLVKFGHGILLGMASGLETLCEQAYDARDYHMLSVYLQRSWLVLLMAAIFLTPLFIFASPVLKFLRQDEAIADMAGNVSHWFIPVIFSIVLLYTCQIFLKAQKRNWITICLMPSMLPLHLFLSWILTIKYKFGIAGAMVPMILAYWVPVIGQLGFIFFGGCRDTWKGFSVLAFEDLRPVINISLSSGVIMCLTQWYNSILMLLTGNMEDAEVAIDAFSICLSFSGSWDMLTSFGFQAAARVRVSDELRSGSSKAAKFAILNILLMSFGYGLVLFILFFFLQERLAYIFTNSAEVAAAVADLSPLLACSILLNSIQSVLSGVVTGAGLQSIVTYINIGCCYLIGIPVGAITAYATKLQVNGVWTGMLICTLVQTIILAIITCKTDWEKQATVAQRRVDKRLVEPEQPNASLDAEEHT